jgi:hypothetical protein
VITAHEVTPETATVNGDDSSMVAPVSQDSSKAAPPKTLEPDINRLKVNKMAGHRWQLYARPRDFRSHEARTTSRMRDMSKGDLWRTMGLSKDRLNPIIRDATEQQNQVLCIRFESPNDDLDSRWEAESRIGQVNTRLASPYVVRVTLSQSVIEKLERVRGNDGRSAPSFTAARLGPLKG